MRTDYCVKETIDGITFYYWYGVDLVAKGNLLVPADRLDLLSYRFLGSCENKWIIAEYNKIFLPISYHFEGNIKVPIVSRIVRK